MRYTITFDPHLKSIDESLKMIQLLGVQIESAQRFIGTAVVEADAKQVKQMMRLDSIAGVTETGSVRAM